MFNIYKFLFPILRPWQVEASGGGSQNILLIIKYYQIIYQFLEIENTATLLFEILPVVLNVFLFCPFPVANRMKQWERYRMVVAQCMQLK